MRVGGAIQNAHGEQCQLVSSYIIGEKIDCPLPTIVKLLGFYHVPGLLTLIIQPVVVSGSQFIIRVFMFVS